MLGICYMLSTLDNFFCFQSNFKDKLWVGFELFGIIYKQLQIRIVKLSKLLL